MAVYAVRATPALTWVAVVLGVPVVALTVAEGFVPGNEQVVFWSAILHAAFYGYTGYGLIRYLFDDSWVTRDEIFAVGANFTVVSWMFAYLFMAVQVVYPGSFTAYQGEGHRTFLELLYLSVRQPHQRGAVRRHGGAAAGAVGRDHRAGRRRHVRRADHRPRRRPDHHPLAQLSPSSG